MIKLGLIETADKLEETKSLLIAAVASMKEANGFDQLSAGYGVETFGETLFGMIRNIREYQEDLAREEVGGE